MRSPRYSLRFLLILTTVSCIAIRWYTWPDLLTRLREEVPVAEGERLSLLIKQTSKLDRDELFEFQDFIVDRLYDDKAARKRFETVGYEWAKSSPQEAKAWMKTVCSPDANGGEYGFYFDPFPDPIVLGFTRAFCEADFDEAYQLLSQDHFFWDDGSHITHVDIIVSAMEKKSFDELVAWFGAQSESEFLYDMILASEHLLLEKDFDGYLALMPKQFGNWDKRWVDVLSTYPLARVDHDRLRQLLEESFPDDHDTSWYYTLSERYYRLADSWTRVDARGCAAWAEKQSGDRIGVGPMIRAWPENDLGFLVSWISANFERLDANSSFGYLIERLPPIDAIQFAGQLIARMNELPPSTVVDAISQLHEIDPKLAQQKLKWAQSEAIKHGGNTNNEMLKSLCR